MRIHYYKPVEILSLAFISLLSLITIIFSASIPHWGWQLARYGILALAIIAAAEYIHRSRIRPAAARYFHAFLPVLVILVVFDSLGDIIPWIWPRFLDDLLIRIDYAIFGVHPTVWMERFVHPVVTDALMIAYLTYYPMSVTLGILLLARGRNLEFDKVIFSITICFFLTYVGYMLVPAVGPRFTLIDLQTIGLQGSAFTLAAKEVLNTLEYTKTNVFPSGHTAVSLITLYYAWKYREMIYAALLLPIVLALVISTVYLRYHYVIDVVAGVLLTWFTIVIAPRLFRLLSASQGKAQQQLHDPA